MSQQARPLAIARQTVAFSRQSDLWDGLIPKTIAAYRVDDLRDLPLIERKRRLAGLLGQGEAASHPVRRTSDG